MSISAARNRDRPFTDYCHSWGTAGRWQHDQQTLLLAGNHTPLSRTPMPLACTKCALLGYCMGEALWGRSGPATAIIISGQACSDGTCHAPSIHYQAIIFNEVQQLYGMNWGSGTSWFTFLIPATLTVEYIKVNSALQSPFGKCGFRHAISPPNSKQNVWGADQCPIIFPRTRRDTSHESCHVLPARSVIAPANHGDDIVGQSN